MKIKIDNYTTLDVKLPETMSLLEFKGLTTRLNKMINTKQLEEETGEQIKHIGRPKKNKPTHERWTPKQAKTIIKEFNKATNKEEYAAQYGLNKNQMYAKTKYWTYKTRNKKWAINVIMI